LPRDRLRDWCPTKKNSGASATIDIQWPTPLRSASVRLVPPLSFSLCITIFFLPAHQNETTVKTLKLGMMVPTIISLVLRFLFRRSSLPPSKFSLALYVVTFFPSLFLSNYLIKIGTPRRDPTTGTLLSYGEDLNQSGVTEWCFDILYVTCAFQYPSLLPKKPNQSISKGTCQIGSGGFGEWFWLLYMVVCYFIRGGLSGLIYNIRSLFLRFLNYGHL